MQVNEQETLIGELRKVVIRHLESNPRLSVNALSKRSNVSEATLRRIVKDQIKTEPCPDTVLEVLIAITKEQKISELAKMFPGIIADKLKAAFGFQTHTSNYQYVPELEQELNDEISYLVYKIAANTNGVSIEQIKSSFGIIGLERLEKLIEKKLIEFKDGQYHAIYKSFSMSNQVFIRNFKSVAQFINISKNRDLSQNLFYNLSESISREAYQEVLKIQKQALKKISQIINDEKNKGDIPFFHLTAVDRFDHKASETPKNLQ